MPTFRHGNSYQLIYNIKKPDGNIKDLTGTLELKYQLAKRVESLTSLVSYILTDSELNITDPINGKITVDLTSTLLNTIKAGSYYHEIWQINALGDPTTLLSERITIEDRLIEQ